MRIYDKGSIERFTRWLNAQESVEVLPTINNPYLYYKYRREEFSDGYFTGSYNFGYIYVNSRGRYTLTEAAVDDWKAWTS